jgi:protein-disulfide isomerase
MRTLPRRLVSDFRTVVARPLLLLVVFLVVAGAASAVAFFPGESALRSARARQAARPASSEEKTEFVRYWESLPRVTVPVPSDGAAVVIVKFSDYQCPACGQSFFDDRPILSKYESQFPGAVKFITKDYPLQPECNANMLRPFHTASCDAAVAVRLARRVGKGEALEEYFYGHQQMMSPVTVREAARSIGGVTDFDQGYAQALDGIKADVGLARLLGVRSTPTFFVNGVKLEGPTVQTLDLAIAYELRKAGKIK